MMVPTHILATTLVAYGLDLHDQDMLLAYLFGVVIDLDHMYAARTLWRERTISFMKIRFQHRWPVAHSILFLPVVIGSCLWFHTFIPGWFWLIHLGLDLLQDLAMHPWWPISRKAIHYGFIPAESRKEWIVSFTGLCSFGLIKLLTRF